mgnify:FL=1
MNLEEEVKLLRNELREVREENKYLKETIKAILHEFEEFKKIIKEKSKPSFVKEDVTHNPLKTGQKEGHKGYSRYIPERIDEIKPVDSEECPDCGEKLSGIQDVRSRVVTEIEVKTKNTQYIIHRRYCKNCCKIVEPKIEEALPNSRFGLKLMLLVLILKLDSRIPSNKIVSILDTIFGIKISDGEIYNILEQLTEAYGDYYEELVKKIKEALIKNMDETSWRINGENNWLWLFINKEVALYVVNQKRSSKVPIETLGKQEGKFGVTDRFSAYNILVEETGISQQICWAHLLRNTKDLAKYYPEAKYVHKRFKYIYAKAKEGKTSVEKLLHWIDLIRERGRSFKSMNTKKFLRSVCVNHRDDLFRFVDNPEIESTNNRAESGLRPADVIRKISGGSRSSDGAETTAKLLSIMQTMKMQDGNIIDNFTNLLHKGK